jgi:hypothetical protein
VQKLIAKDVKSFLLNKFWKAATQFTEKEMYVDKKFIADVQLHVLKLM